ncbi:MAG: tRNA (5-methylaminomethyl-2-thiouridine)(34)-methyltransferase MnmD [Nanoarchaeota archaeon]
MEKIQTKDGSYTFYNEKYGDIYHSKSGAREEAFEKFAKPALIQFMQIPPRKISILDICFGLGYNSCAAIDFAARHFPDTELKIIGLENDPEILEEIKNIKPGFQHYDKIKAATENEYNAELLKIKIIRGNASETIMQAQPADIVFHDPFSPKKHPELWTLEFFTKVYEKLVQGGMLLTYSCAKKIRENLEQAGFKVEDGPIVGRVAPSTIAYKLKN